MIASTDSDFGTLCGERCVLMQCTFKGARKGSGHADDVHGIALKSPFYSRVQKVVKSRFSMCTPTKIPRRCSGTSKSLSFPLHRSNDFEGFGSLYRL